MRNQPALQRLIPITRVRHFYKLLRDFPKEKLQLEVAKELCRKPKPLAKMIVDSREHFAFYDNRLEAFHDRPTAEILTSARLQSRHLANTLVQDLARTRNHVIEIADAQQYDFKVVDYEISPLRTTASNFENGQSGQPSGAGGMDLMLASQVGQAPIVGEIKADTDVNPFLGLIQSLMYAIELSTAPQRARLNRFYQNRFAEWAPETGIDIYLILLRYPDDDRSQEFLNLTSRIAANLVAYEGLSPIIRRVVALKNAMNQDALAPFTVAFAHGVSMAPVNRRSSVEIERAEGIT